jgi:hypothetical protein
LHIYDAVSNFSPLPTGWSKISVTCLGGAAGTRSVPAPLSSNRHPNNKKWQFSLDSVPR